MRGSTSEYTREARHTLTPRAGPPSPPLPTRTRALTTHLPRSVLAPHAESLVVAHGEQMIFDQRQAKDVVPEARQLPQQPAIDGVKDTHNFGHVIVGTKISERLTAPTHCDAPAAAREVDHRVAFLPEAGEHAHELPRDQVPHLQPRLVFKPNEYGAIIEPDEDGRLESAHGDRAQGLGGVLEAAEGCEAERVGASEVCRGSALLIRSREECTARNSNIKD